MCFDEYIVVAVCCVAMFILVIVVWVNFFPPRIDTYEYPSTTVDDMLKGVQTGDLILMTGKTYSEKLIRRITRSPFSHVAMVVVEEGIVYLWESDVGQSRKEGSRVIELKEKLKRYKGEKKGLWLKWVDSPSTPRPTVAQLLPIISTYKDITMPFGFEYYLFSGYPNSFIYNVMKPTSNGESIPPDMYCSELIANTLQKLGIKGIVNEEKIAASYSPKSFLSMPHLFTEATVFDFKDVALLHS